MSGEGLGKGLIILDRDGVINRRLPDDYVKQWSEFVFLPGVLEAIAHLSSRFGRTVVVTNQQGIGKGLMDREAVEKVHAQMQEAIEEARDRSDSLGGTVTCVCRNLPPGWGEPCFDKLEAALARAMLSIPATKGFEIVSIIAV